MPTAAKSRPWTKYWDKYQYVLPYTLDKTYPFKQLADELGVHPNAVRQMVKWVQVQPEVIQYLRENYKEDDLPPWVGTLEGETTTVDEGTTMEGQDPTTDEEDSTTDEEDVEEDAPIQPIQAKGIERVRQMVPLGAPQEREVVPQSSPLVPFGAPQSGPPSGAPQGGTPPTKEKKAIPASLVEQEKPKIREPEMQEVITPAQRELVAELQRMQEHDPDIVPQRGGGWVRILRSKTGQPIGTIPVADPTPELSPKVSQLMSEATMENLDINTRTHEESSVESDSHHGVYVCHEHRGEWGASLHR